MFSVAIPNMYFWFWQYLSLSAFKREDREDIKTLRAYNSGEYDNEEDPEQGKADRERNRGMDRQTHGKYDNEDNGGDTTRPL